MLTFIFFGTLAVFFVTAYLCVTHQLKYQLITSTDRDSVFQGLCDAGVITIALFFFVRVGVFFFFSLT